MHFHSLDSRRLSGAGGWAPKLEGAFLLLFGRQNLWFPPPWAEFPAPGSRVTLRFEARQLLVWQGGRGKRLIYLEKDSFSWFSISLYDTHEFLYLFDEKT